MALDAGAKISPSILVRPLDGIIVNSRPAAQPLFDDIPARAEFGLKHAGPPRIAIKTLKGPPPRHLAVVLESPKQRTERIGMALNPDAFFGRSSLFASQLNRNK